MSSISYSVEDNILVVRLGKHCQKIVIYEICNGKVVLSKQFKILNLYLNLSTIGLFVSHLAREIQPGSEFTTDYQSTGLAGDSPNDSPGASSCLYMTFKSLSEKDEAHTISRTVMPRGELIQLYQINFTYRIIYYMTNLSTCDATVEFLFPNFTLDDISGAAYPAIDMKGNTVKPIVVKGKAKGSFLVNGYQSLLLVKCSRNLNIRLRIAGSETNDFPPPDKLVLPIETRFGTADVLVYENIYTNMFIRHISDEFKGINSIVRGFHFSVPNFPCFGTTGNIIAPPPYSNPNMEVSKSPDMYREQPGDSVTLLAEYAELTSVVFTRWSGLYYLFEDQSLRPPGSFVELADVRTVYRNDIPVTYYSVINLNTQVTRNFHMRVAAIIEFTEPYRDTDPLIFGMYTFNLFTSAQETCKCDNTCPLLTLGNGVQDNEVGTKYLFAGEFTFNNYDNKSFQFYFGTDDEDLSRFVIREGSRLNVTLTILGGPVCDSNSV